MNKKEAQRYRELQERKKRQLERQRQHGSESSQPRSRRSAPDDGALDLDYELEKRGQLQRPQERAGKRAPANALPRSGQRPAQRSAQQRPPQRSGQRPPQRRQSSPEDLEGSFFREKSAKPRRGNAGSGNGRGEQPLTKKQAKQLKKQEKMRKKKFGLFAKLQFLASVAFMVAQCILYILPWWYMVIIGVVLFLLFLPAFMKQTGRAKHGIHAFFSILLIAILCVGTYYSLLADQALRKIGGDGSDTVTTDVEHESFNVYLSGIDVYGDVSQNSRSDVNIIATLNPNTHQMLLTTTPRDYYVEIPNVSQGQGDKLTHAGLYGVNASMDTLENLYGIDIEMYARINFSSLIDIIDVMGGITVDSDVAFKTSKAAGYVTDISKGKNTLNGKEALAFSRERHNLEDGDNQRGKNQEAVIKGIMNQMFTPQTLVNSGKIIDVVCKNVITNMTDKQLRALIRAQLNTLKGWEMESTAAVGTASREYCYSYAGNSLYVTLPDETSIANIKAKIEEVMSAKSTGILGNK